MQQIRERSGSMTAGQRYFVMSRIFLLSHKQISEIEGTSPDNASALVRRTADQLRAGEIELFPVSETEAKEAKSRLDAVRGRRRKHRVNNVERERARDRERYARKKALSK